ncbi:transglycosylase SLT domain-containing protein [Streptomyces sp. NPDC057363]|uniref:transglycosylase SLT domain-containing protein n=1 Tax=Streptomyces sp. NPDC057363 TaxID=3346107 RepID=UPI0036375C5D
MAESGRGPIKVGTGYVEIVPQVKQKDMTELRSKITREMERIGAAASKEANKAVVQGLAGLPREVEKQAKKAKAATEKEARDSKKTLTRIARELTQQYGREAADRFLEAQKREKQKVKLVEKTSSATKKALRETVAAEEKAAKDTSRRWAQAEKERTKATQQRARETERAERQQRTEAEKTAKDLIRYNKMIRDAYAENERRKRQDAQQTHNEEIRWGRTLAQAYAENERRKRQEAAQTAREEQTWRRTVSQAYAENERRNQAAIRQTQAVQRAAHQQALADIRAQATAQRLSRQDQLAGLRQTIAANRAQIGELNTSIVSTGVTTESYFKKVEGGLKKTGTWFHELGTQITEAGNILTTRFLAPLALAGTGLTAIGVESADKRMLGQLGLAAAGVSADQSTRQMEKIQHYAIDTPFSIDVMHEYQMKLIRSIAGADKNWYSDNAGKRIGAANTAATKTTDLIMSIGDSMARAGNLNPDQFRRAMYAIDMIMDMDRAPTRNVKQLAASTGMPAAELAQLLGFKDAEEMWKVIGTPAAKGGGVSGTEIMNSMLNYWNPEKYGKKYGPMTDGGSVGSASAMTSATITGRLQQMKERATFELGTLFADDTGPGGKYEYTKLGRLLMGDEIMKRDRHGELTGTGEYEGGLLNQWQDMAKEYAPDVKKFLEAFLEGLQGFTSMVDTAASYLKESGLGALAMQVGKFLAVWGPLILAVGLATKLFGKVLGMGSRALTPLRAVGRGAVGAYDGVRNSRQRAQDTTDRWDARSEARRQTRDSGGTRREARQAGRRALREERARQREGDARSPARRVVDGLTGRNSQGSGNDMARRQIRDLTEAIQTAQQESDRLQREIQEINRESLRQITAALAGNGTGTVQGAAGQAQQGLQQAQQQAQRLNQINLNQAEQELNRVKAKADELTKSIKDSASAVQNLDSRKLGSLRAQQIETTTKRAQDLKAKTNEVSTAVQNLNGKSLASVRDQFVGTTKAADGTNKATKNVSSSVETLKVKSLRSLRDWFDRLTSSANEAYKKVGTRSGTGSLNGRVKSLSDQSLKGLNSHVTTLEKNLKNAKEEAQGLNTSLGEISKKAPGGGGGGGKRDPNARGGVKTQADVPSYAGVMPGYAPWVDNIPAVLSPGEAVLRPEVTNHLGADTINTWNALAIRGQLSRHARGSSGGGGTSLASIRELIGLQDIAPVGTSMLKTMKMDGTSDPLGGGVRNGILGTGDRSAGLGGSVAATKFKGMYDWMTKDIYTQLKRVPSGIGQVAGILGGALSPVLTDYFWSDVWKGNGNIVERGKDYLGHVFSMDTLSKVWDNLFSGVTDSLGAIWDTVTNPIDSFTGLFDDIGGIVSGSYNNLIGYVETAKEIKEAPGAYAGRVFNGFMANAQESMPNTKGLFDFSKGSKVNADTPDFGAGMSSPGAGGGAQRWAPVAAQALGMLGLPGTALPTVLHRIGVESGGDPNIVNKWDSNWQAGYPSVGLMQVIGPTFQRWAGMFRKTGPFLYGTSVNPLANIYAGLNYARNRYGSRWQSVLSGTTGYASGTNSASPGLAMVGEKGRELVAFGGGERVFNNEETEGLLNGKRYEIHIHEARNEPTPQAVLRALQTAEALYTNL